MRRGSLIQLLRIIHHRHKITRVNNGGIMADKRPSKEDPAKQKHYAIKGLSLTEALRKVVEAGPYPEEAKKHPSRSGRHTNPDGPKADPSE